MSLFYNNFNKKVVHFLVFLSKNLKLKTPLLNLRMNFILFADLSIFVWFLGWSWYCKSVWSTGKFICTNFAYFIYLCVFLLRNFSSLRCSRWFIYNSSMILNVATSTVPNYRIAWIQLFCVIKIFYPQVFNKYSCVFDSLKNKCIMCGSRFILNYYMTLHVSFSSVRTVVPCVVNSLPAGMQ